ncbi:MAG: PAS domain S-box protein [Streptococcus sp.]|nr:PAS domain S-box protein [Streptococcus sp.]
MTKDHEHFSAPNANQEQFQYLLKFFGKVIDSLQAAVLITDEDLFITAVNSVATDLFNLNRDAMEGTPLRNIIPCQRLASLSPEDDIELEEFQEEVTVIKTQGLSIPLLVSVSPISFEDGTLEGYVCQAMDLSQRKELERKLLHSQKLESVGQLAAGIAHEINTPIQYIRDNMRFFQSEFENIKNHISLCHGLISPNSDLLNQAKNHADTIELDFLLQEIPDAIVQTLEGAESVAIIVRSMKEFSHPGVAQAVLVDLNKTIESTTIVCRNEWKYLAKLELDFKADTIFVEGYPGELGQVFLNIIVNSAHAIADAKEKHPDREGLISITTSDLGELAQITISDNGCGMGSDIIQKIFDPFFTTKQVGRGTGQGLNFVHNTIVERHHGNIECKSTLDQGSTFTIQLPKHLSKL